MNIEDKIVLKEIQKQNKAVFEAMFHEYYPGLLKFSENIVFDREVAEDILQNLFIYIWEHAEYLKITSSLKSYLYISIKNRCLNYLRNRRIEDKNQLLYIEAGISNLDENNMEPEIFYQIQEAINSLPPKMREIFRLKYEEERSIGEISKSLQLSENTVKTQLLRAKGKLRILLKESIGVNFFL